MGLNSKNHGNKVEWLNGSAAIKNEIWMERLEKKGWSEAVWSDGVFYVVDS